MGYGKQSQYGAVLFNVKTFAWKFDKTHTVLKG